MLRLNERSTAPEGVGTRNPAFDVTPNKYVTAIITEMGVAWPPYGESLFRMVENRKETASIETEQVTGGHSG